jgi:hypothetical protein
MGLRGRAGAHKLGFVGKKTVLGLAIAGAAGVVSLLLPSDQSRRRAIAR